MNAAIIGYGKMGKEVEKVLTDFFSKHNSLKIHPLLNITIIL